MSKHFITHYSLFSTQHYIYVTVIALSLLIHLPVVSLATDGVIQLPRTGQTTCYDTTGLETSCTGTGQDGDIQAGAVWPIPRLVDNGDGTVIDKLNGLMWVKDVNLIATRDANFDNDYQAGDGRVTWQHALDYVKKLNTDSYLGYSDWRLPNKKELYCLYDYLWETYGICGPPNPLPFTNIPFPNYQWSSSTYVDSPDHAWIIWGSANKSDHACVWAVRSESCGESEGSPLCLPKTGQTKCWDTYGNLISCSGTGQDGDIQAGISWPDPRFTDNGDGSVTDNLTGLLWAKDANIMANRDPSFDVDDISGDGAVNWQHALDYVKKLNTDSYLGYGDWRLPNKNELESLIDYEKSWPTLPYPFTTNTLIYYHWTSTTLTGNGFSSFGDTSIAFVGDWNGNIQGDLKTNEYNSDAYSNYVWPVRAGQIGNPITTTTTAIPSNPCVAEEIYGEYSEETELLRYLRDNVLSTTPEGQKIVKLYYEWSPIIVKAMKEDMEFKKKAKEMIDEILPLLRGDDI